MAAALEQYLWIAILGGICGFFYAFGIGANDVANAFASTVSSKSLTLKQAVVVAGIFEFLGALLLGASVTTTIRSGIFDATLYKDEPEIVLLGMFTSLLTGTIMLLGATAMALPVSTTHTIVGSIMGFSIAAKGFSSINVDVVVKIVVSWVISPVVSGIIGFIFFWVIRKFVMRTDNPFQRAYYSFPIILAIGIGIDLFFVLYKGLKNTAAKDFPLYASLPTSFAIGIVCGCLWIWPFGPRWKKRIEKQEREANDEMTGDGGEAAITRELTNGNLEGGLNIEKDGSLGNDEERSEECKEDEESPKESQTKEVKIQEKTESDGSSKEGGEEVAPDGEEKKRGYFQRMSRSFAQSTYDQDLHAQSMKESKRASEIWDSAEQFDPKAEQLFTAIQVFTACLNAFAHGANDVSNAIAPLSAIILIYQTGEIESKAPVQKWVLAYGGVAIVLGLLIYGYKVMKSIGFKLCMLSPSRAASGGLAASLFVVTASFLGIPVSSTQCIVGGLSGVGLVGGVKNVQWLFLGKVAIGWVLIFTFAAILSAGLFAMCAYSPSLV